MTMTGTQEDFSRVALELGRPFSGWSEELARFVGGWARSMDDEEISRWIGMISSAQGARCQAAALVAIQRARAGRPDSGKRFLAAAEMAVAAAETAVDPHTVDALIPARWLLGQTEQADLAFAAVEKSLTDQVGPEPAMLWLVSLAALGRRHDIVRNLAPGCFANSDLGSSQLVPGLVALLEDNVVDILELLLAAWYAQSQSADESLSQEILRGLDFAGTPERYIELAAKHPVLKRGQLARIAMVHAEGIDPVRAVAAAKLVLAAENDFDDSTLPLAVAILAAHAPQAAEAWAATAPVLSNLARPDRVGYLAALGRHDEVRKAIATIVSSGDEPALREAIAVVGLTTDRSLATHTIETLLAQPSLRFHHPLLVQLHDCGEASHVQEILEAWLGDLEALVPKERDPGTRAFAQTAGLLGRADLGLRAVKLPVKARREYTAAELVRGCVEGGDWGGALAALELIPDDDGNGRASVAVQKGLRAHTDSPYLGARALPLRCC